MSTNKNLAFTKSGASPSMTVSPPLVEGTVRPSEALEPPNYDRLPYHIGLVVLYTLPSTVLHTQDSTNKSILAALAKLALMAVVGYLPGDGSRRLRPVVSDICQWVLLIACVVISVKVVGNENTPLPTFSLFARLFFDYMSFLLAMSWKSMSRLRPVGYMPHRLIWASFHQSKERTTDASKGHEYDFTIVAPNGTL
ncbi:hypothetical protein C8F01DRAFT_1256405 [Mycena amicta]|nr:hypothetical protein C8F01DRAFT_1256405 [Mycena amicta]